MAQKLLKSSVPEMLFEIIEARDAQHGGEKEGNDDISCRNVGVASAVLELLEYAADVVDAYGVTDELVEAQAFVEPFVKELEKTHLFWGQQSLVVT
jgi:hypothetical protein